MSKILWIDDDHAMIVGLMRPLQKAGHVIDPARTITSALEKLHADEAYALAVVDILLPIDESVQASVPECIRSAGDHTGEGLIVYMRDALGLRIPIIVMSILASDSQLVARLEPYEISDFLVKGSVFPTQVKTTVEQALSEHDHERATRLNLRSRRREERKVGLIAAARMPPTRKLYRALANLQRSETDPELREFAESILKTYPLEMRRSDAEVVPSAECHVFLSHNSTDKPLIERLAHRLIKAGIQPWLDTWNLIPGEPWQEAIEEALDACQTVAVFLGPSGVGPWENEEMRSAIAERVRDKSRRVIPVLLPGSSMPVQEQLPRFLRRLTWVDFRNGLDDAGAFHRLVSGIKGVAPGSFDSPT